MKIIFLDIDGVLNSDNWLQSEASKTGSYPENKFDPNAVRLLNKMVQQTNAKLVLTSTWRLQYSLKEMQILFQKVGIQGELIPNKS